MERTPQEIIEETFRLLDQQRRPASVAEVGGFRPPDDPLVSWFGGHFVGAEGETWPEHQGRPMWPLLQVFTRELPYCPPLLADVAAFTVFVVADDLPLPHSRNGEGWLLRHYKSEKGLSLLRQPELHTRIRPFPIRWVLLEADGLEWDDALNAVDFDEFNDLDERDETLDPVDLFYDRYSSQSGTKVGGWPAHIQSGKLPHQEFVFQIGTERKSHWSWGDNGIGYFYCGSVGDWIMDWQCY